MKNYENKLREFIEVNGIDCEHLVFEESCHTAQEAADAAGAELSDLVKNICLKTEDDQIVVVIVKGEDKIDTKKVAAVLGAKRVKSMTMDEILERTTYPCGGVPSFGYEARFIVDEQVLQKKVIYTGGGSEFSLIKIDPKLLIKVNSAIVSDIRK